MIRNNTPFRLLGISFLGIVATAAYGQLDVGSDGSDGALVVSANTEIDLSQAVTASWDTPSPTPGKGVYDPDKWAVVFKYASVTVNANTTVTFKNHPSRAPVVWLVAGDVTINGIVGLSGRQGHASGLSIAPADPGPGGFRGARGIGGSSDGSGGYGPGGAILPISGGTAGAGGSYGTSGVPASWGDGGTPGPTYGSERSIPLIGGSGGAAGRAGDGSGAGAGGGAILIAANGTITINGQLLADGGMSPWRSGGGSGGTIRLVGNRRRQRLVESPWRHSQRLWWQRRCRTYPC